jgi:hypothetical protein
LGLQAKGYGETHTDDCTALLTAAAQGKMMKPPPNWPGTKFGVIQKAGWIAKLGTGRFVDEWEPDAVASAQEGCRDTVAALMGIEPASLTRFPERVSVKPPGAPAMYAHLDQNRRDDLQCVIVPTSAAQRFSGRIGGRVWVCAGSVDAVGGRGSVDAADAIGPDSHRRTHKDSNKQTHASQPKCATRFQTTAGARRIMKCTGPILKCPVPILKCTGPVLKFPAPILKRPARILKGPGPIPTGPDPIPKLRFPMRARPGRILK